MNLSNKIKEDLEQALREKRETELSVLRMLRAAILNKEKEKRYKLAKGDSSLSEQSLEKESGLPEEEILDVISSEIKKRKEAQVLFEKGERKELAEKEKKEAEILIKYLPEQISEEALRKIANEVILDLGAKDPKDMGKVISQILPKVRGRADGSLVSRIVKESLQK